MFSIIKISDESSFAKRCYQIRSSNSSNITSHSWILRLKMETLKCSKCFYSTRFPSHLRKHIEYMYTCYILVTFVQKDSSTKEIWITTRRDNMETWNSNVNFVISRPHSRIHQFPTYPTGQVSVCNLWPFYIPKIPFSIAYQKCSQQ